GERGLVVRAVLRLYGFVWGSEWSADEQRESEMVFIADELPEAKIRAGFEALAAG
ncbi:GTP-binding protein, partial [Pseudomonas sp.]|uniref:GTP-binding protein n=1 Tax=Pseudomonas sp. TaxID=306 RepID=UPI0028AB8B97